MNENSGQTYINYKPILSEVSDLLWFEPREIVNKLVPEILTLGDQATYRVEYYFGMFPELHAFICGLIREKRPSKILEVVVN